MQGHYRDNVLVSPHDIEELHKIGEQMGACPYYGTRRAMPLSNIVLLPYQSLLSKESRDSLGITLKDNIVIIDEAHNLIETINDVHSVRTSLKQIQQV